MPSIRSTILSGLTAAALTTPSAAQSDKADLPGCGEVNVFYTGLPAYHPYVVQQGWDPVKVDAGIRNGTLEMLNAGYNVKLVLSPPENGLEPLREQMKGTHWHSTGIGMGVRAATISKVIDHFEDLIHLFRDEAPQGVQVFNYDPWSFLWSLERRVPLGEDCAREGKVGKNLGYEILFDGYKGADLYDGLDSSYSHLLASAPEVIGGAAGVKDEL